MSAPVVSIPLGRVAGHAELYSVPHHAGGERVLFVDESQDFDYPRNNAEYVRGLGFLFNAPERLTTKGVA